VLQQGMAYWGNTGNGGPGCLFRYNFPEGNCDGPALVISPKGKPKVLMVFASGVRVGILRYWTEDGDPRLFFKPGTDKEPGKTILFEKGSPVLLEEQSRRKAKPSLLLLVTKDGVLRKVTIEKIEKTDKSEQSRRLTDVLQKVRNELASEEAQWGNKFDSWWKSCDEEIQLLQDQMQMQTSRDPKVINAQLQNLQKKVDKFKSDIKSKGGEGRDKLLGDLKI
jgi:hypothetical protein